MESDSDYEDEDSKQIDVSGPVNTIPKDLYIDKCVDEMYAYMNDEKNLRSFEDDSTDKCVKPCKTPKYLAIDTCDESNEDVVHTANKNCSYMYHLKRYDSRMYKSPYPIPPHCQARTHVDLTFSLDGDYTDLGVECKNMVGGKTLKLKIDTTALKEFIKAKLHSTTTKDYHIKPVSIRTLSERNDFASEVGFGLYSSVPGQQARKLWCDNTGFATWDTANPVGLYAVGAFANGMPVVNRRMMWKCHPMSTTAEFARFLVTNSTILKKDLKSRVSRGKDATLEVNGKQEKVYRFLLEKESTRVFSIDKESTRVYDAVLLWIVTSYGPLLYKDHVEFPGLTPVQMATLMVPKIDKETGPYILVLKTVFDRLISSLQYIMNQRDHLMNLDKLEGEISFTRPRAETDMKTFIANNNKAFGTFKITVRLEFEKFVTPDIPLLDATAVTSTTGGGGLTQTDISAIARLMLQGTQTDTSNSLAAHVERAISSQATTTATATTATPTSVHPPVRSRSRKTQNLFN